MKCPLVLITRVPQDCIEDKCYFWDLDHGKWKWMSNEWKKGFAKNVDIRWRSMVDLNTYITATISFVDSINHLLQEKDDKIMTWKKSNNLKISVTDTGWFRVI